MNLHDRDMMKIGEREGRQEKAEEAAKTMLTDHLPTDKVALYSGLPLEQVLELQKELAAQPSSVIRLEKSSRVDFRTRVSQSRLWYPLYLN